MIKSSKQASRNKTIPKQIEEEVLTALQFYPQLGDTSIIFKFKSSIKKSVMQAQPEFKSFLRQRKDRRYYIFISEKFRVGDQIFLTKNIPSDVMTGWIGHELGHLMDYERRSKWNLFWFGLKYLYLPSFTREAERTADVFAINHGMEKYILKTKNFILKNADLADDYKSRIKKFYLSPEDIMQLVNERDSA